MAVALIVFGPSGAPVSPAALTTGIGLRVERARLALLAIAVVLTVAVAAAVDGDPGTEVSQPR